MISERSIQTRKERDEDLAREKARREQDKMNNDLELEELRRKMEEIKRREEIDERLSQIKVAAIHKVHEEQQRILEEEEGYLEERERSLRRRSCAFYRSLVSLRLFLMWSELEMRLACQLVQVL